MRAVLLLIIPLSIISFELNLHIPFKRPERIKESLPIDWGEEWNNVWLGVSVETQKYFTRAAKLAQIPCKTRFISAEPLLGELDILPVIDGKKVINSFQWLIIGGESGNDTGKYFYSPCELAWIISDAMGFNLGLFSNLQK